MKAVWGGKSGVGPASSTFRLAKGPMDLIGEG